MKMHWLLALPFTALTLAACGQKTTTPPASKLYTKLGVMQAGKSDTSSEVLAKFATITPTGHCLN
ncbi:hypothetical protein [Deinococcus alpinitundrae]|uniref:hypothetical protein n=1 Tax=Deinococcus alpinitundrae TaxID=468913 RepID=UPI00137B4313|nr:hypothetical protein [Deinococcus alpinitundrae]